MFTAIISTQNLRRLRKAGPGTRLYGVIRLSEELVHVESVGEERPGLGLIGSVCGSPGERFSNGAVLLARRGPGLEAWIAHQGRSLPCQIEPYDLNSLYARTPFPKKLMRKLWRSKVVIFGLGTGGSYMALEVARAGVGRMVLCDPERFDSANASRHECDLLDVGRFKVLAVKERIQRINPNILVQAVPLDVFDSSASVDLNALLLNADLAVAATDKVAVQLQINYETWERKIPAVFGGCYEEAKGGEVFFTLPSEGTICYECLRGGIEQPPRKTQFDYSAAGSPAEYQGEPGLHSAVNFVTSVEVQIVLGILLREEKSGLSSLINPRCNYLLVGGALGAGYFRFKRPFEIFFQSLRGPREDCGCCQRKHGKTYGEPSLDALPEGLEEKSGC